MPRREALKSVGPWQPDDDVTHCNSCHVAFAFLKRRHHCRNCGKIFCGACSNHKRHITELRAGVGKVHKVCNECDAVLRSLLDGSFPRPQIVRKMLEDTPVQPSEARSSGGGGGATAATTTTSPGPATAVTSTTGSPTSRAESGGGRDRTNSGDKQRVANTRSISPEHPQAPSPFASSRSSSQQQQGQQQQGRISPMHPSANTAAASDYVLSLTTQAAAKFNQTSPVSGGGGSETIGSGRHFCEAYGAAAGGAGIMPYTGAGTSSRTIGTSSRTVGNGDEDEETDEEDDNFGFTPPNLTQLPPSSDNSMRHLSGPSGQASQQTHSQLSLMALIQDTALKRTGQSNTGSRIAVLLYGGDGKEMILNVEYDSSNSQTIAELTEQLAPQFFSLQYGSFKKRTPEALQQLAARLKFSNENGTVMPPEVQVAKVAEVQDRLVLSLDVPTVPKRHSSTSPNTTNAGGSSRMLSSGAVHSSRSVMSQQSETLLCGFFNKSERSEAPQNDDDDHLRIEDF